MDNLIKKLRSLNIDVIYSDTDSIICNKEIPKDLISSKISYFKEEYPNKIIEKITIIAPKTYEFKFSDNRNLIKFKGIKTNTLNSFDIENLYFSTLNFFDIKKLYKGDKKLFL
jgi:hypothetical protein